MSENDEILLVIWAFWLAVIGLDLAALVSLRRSGIHGTARAVWAIWIVVAPIVGAISYFIVGPNAPASRPPEGWDDHVGSLGPWQEMEGRDARTPRGHKANFRQPDPGG